MDNWTTDIEESEHSCYPSGQTTMEVNASSTLWLMETPTHDHTPTRRGEDSNSPADQRNNRRRQRITQQTQHWQRLTHTRRNQLSGEGTTGEAGTEQESLAWVGAETDEPTPYGTTERTARTDRTTSDKEGIKTVEQAATRRESKQ